MIKSDSRMGNCTTIYAREYMKQLLMKINKICNLI